MTGRHSPHHHGTGRRALALGALLLALGTGASLAGDDRDHERARRALEAGEVLPLRTILERVERDHPGQAVDVELERDALRGRWIYEIKLLQSGGALVKLKVDARDATVLGRKAGGRSGD